MNRVVDGIEIVEVVVKCRVPRDEVEEHVNRVQQLLDRYLAYQPRNSFQGLPPLRDEACVAWVQKMLADGRHLLAVSPQDDLLGHAALFPMHATACELLVVVWLEHQNRGVGTKLVQSAIELSRQLRFERMVLSVEATNVHARHVYEKCGFQYRGQACHGEVRMVRHLGEVETTATATIEAPPHQQLFPNLRDVRQFALS